MANTIVRVELHGATNEAQYQKLHQAMAAIGFERTIVEGNTRARMQLPTAMYYSTRYATVPAARDAAWKAALPTGLARAVVAAGEVIAWEGLSPA
jgi:hypothetical protein